ARLESFSYPRFSTSLRNGRVPAGKKYLEPCQQNQHRRRETKMSVKRSMKTAKRSVWKRKTLLAAALVSGLAGGGMVGPNYRKPVVQTPANFRDLSENAQVQAQAASFADLPWWQVFEDPQLQELIRTALKQNYDLQIATERINAARAQVTISKSHLYPQVQGNGDFIGGKEGNFQTTRNFLNLDVDAAFQLDFFGKLRRANEAARAELFATEDA